MVRGRWFVYPRVGFARVHGTFDTANIAAVAAAAAWNVPLSVLVKTSFGVASRVWRPTPYRWIWQRGLQQYVLRRKVPNEDEFSLCSANIHELVDAAMLKWGLTMAQLTRGVQPSAEIPGGVDEEEMPATQPYPEEVLSVPEVEAVCVAKQEQALADQAEEQEDSNDDSKPPANVNWGAARFVVAAMAADPRMLPGDIADLEGRAVGHTCKYFRWFVRERVGRLFI